MNGPLQITRSTCAAVVTAAVVSVACAPVAIPSHASPPTAAAPASTSAAATTALPAADPTIALKATPVPAPSPVSVAGVPSTSASAVTSPPPNMEGINTHGDVFGTGADPNMITLGPKLGSHPEWGAYATHYGTTFELGTRGTPLLAPIDMVFVGFSNTSAEYRIQDGKRQTPYDDLLLVFESASPDWPGMIIIAYHLFSSPLLLGHRRDPACGVAVEWGTSGQKQGHVFYPFDDYVVTDKGEAEPCGALIGRAVKRGALIGFAGSVGTHSFVDMGFKVSDASENPTVQKGDRGLHWVQPASFFYWKSYSPGARSPSGVLAYPFETDGYRLPAEQRDVGFKYAP